MCRERLPTPVAAQYAVGQSIGVRGTPAIVTESGDYINGYMPPHDLVEQLRELQQAKDSPPVKAKS